MSRALSRRSLLRLAVPPAEARVVARARRQHAAVRLLGARRPAAAARDVRLEPLGRVEAPLALGEVLGQRREREHALAADVAHGEPGAIEARRIQSTHGHIYHKTHDIRI